MRAVIKADDVERLVREFRQQLERRIHRKGDRCLISRHEILGVVAEEYAELIDAVHNGNLVSIRGECWDVAIAAAVGVASVDGDLEW